MTDMYQKCPVCEGRGQVPGEFYLDNRVNTTAVNRVVTCRTCNGVGAISAIQTTFLTEEKKDCSSCFYATHLCLPSYPPKYEIQCQKDGKRRERTDCCDSYIHEGSLSVNA